MAKPSKERDRRAVVEAMRREQQRKERRRTLLVLLVCAVVALVIVGLAAIPLVRQSKESSRALADLGVSSGAAACQPIVTRKATGNQEHKAEGIDINYAYAPPAFGAHYPTPAPFSRKFYTAEDRPQVEYLVHNLEHGYTILWYDDTVAADTSQMSAIKAIARTYEDMGQKLTGKFIAAPWTSKDGGRAFPSGTHVALTHWSTQDDPSDTSKQQGVWQYCGKASGAVVSDFVQKYPYTDSPEPSAL